jgi:hypothetical protein
MDRKRRMAVIGKVRTRTSPRTLAAELRLNLGPHLP